MTITIVGVRRAAHQIPDEILNDPKLQHAVKQVFKVYNLMLDCESNLQPLQLCPGALPLSYPSHINII